ncbi:hypothetical protein [Halobacterium wangiae]|uniref:hypothetical protein n=1 Tax=Halobacterium wangiae TaxID=2902623 RepID=UPI001E3E2C75|nr:hypothetical protein [Halobacterium wangiae]
MSSQTDPVDGERAGGTVHSDEQTNSEGETEPDATCVVCGEPLNGVTGRETVHRECEPALRCGIALGAPDE